MTTEALMTALSAKYMTSAKPRYDETCDRLEQKPSLIWTANKTALGGPSGSTIFNKQTISIISFIITKLPIMTVLTNCISNNYSCQHYLSQRHFGSQQKMYL